MILIYLHILTEFMMCIHAYLLLISNIAWISNSDYVQNSNSDPNPNSKPNLNRINCRILNITVVQNKFLWIRAIALFFSLEIRNVNKPNSNEYVYVYPID